MVPPKMIALLNDSGVVEQLALFADYGTYVRKDGDWVPIDEDENDPIDGLEAVDASQPFLPIFDMADETDATLMAHDVV